MNKAKLYKYLLTISGGIVIVVIAFIFYKSPFSCGLMGGKLECDWSCRCLLPTLDSGKPCNNTFGECQGICEIDIPPESERVIKEDYVVLEGKCSKFSQGASMCYNPEYKDGKILNNEKSLNSFICSMP